MKPIRFLYYTGMVVLLFLGLTTGFSIFYTALMTQILLLLAVYLIDLWTVFTFCYAQKLREESAVTGSQTILHITIHNEKPIPISLMEVKVNVVAYHENVSLAFSLAPFDRKDFSIPVHMPYRGCYEVGMTVIRITDLFGLMTLRFDMRRFSFYKMAQLLVYPKAAPPNSVMSKAWDAKQFGAAFLKQAEQGDSTAGIRCYMPGDPLRRIHWKNSVKHGTLLIKQYDVDMRETSLILLDSCTKDLTGEDTCYYADTMCACAASIALYSLSRGRSTTVAAYSREHIVSRCESDRDFAPIYAWLARLRYEPEDKLEEMLTQLTRKPEDCASLYVLTSAPRRVCCRSLCHWRKQWNPLR
jgi:uncharacterized protein (DUF58 family)